MSEQPHWEHGMRCHGYWLGLERAAFIHLTPRLPEHSTRYLWSVGYPGPRQPTGEAKTLAQAKRAVETAYREGRAA